MCANRAEEVGRGSIFGQLKHTAMTDPHIIAMLRAAVEFLLDSRRTCRSHQVARARLLVECALKELEATNKG